MAQWVKNLPAMQEMPEMRIQSLGQEDPLDEGMAAHSSILAWKILWSEERKSKGWAHCISKERVRDHWVYIFEGRSQRKKKKFCLHSTVLSVFNKNVYSYSLSIFLPFLYLLYIFTHLRQILHIINFPLWVNFNNCMWSCSHK